MRWESVRSASKPAAAATRIATDETVGVMWPPTAKTVALAAILNLEREFDLRAIALDLAIFEREVELRDLGDPEIANGRCGLGHRRRRGLLPRLGARSNELDELVNTLCHV